MMSSCRKVTESIEYFLLCQALPVMYRNNMQLAKGRKTVQVSDVVYVSGVIPAAKRSSPNTIYRL